MKQVAHCYLSPSGSTRKAGHKICSLLEKKGYATREFDLAWYRGKEPDVNDVIRASSLPLVGSPVYANHAAEPVIALLSNIPGGSGKPALAYVTYGGVSKGSSLYELAEMLVKKGYSVLGLAEVLAAHSMMFRDGHPVGIGHPGEDDWETLASWVDELSPLLERGSGGTMDYAATRPPGMLNRMLDATIFTPRFMRHFWPNIRFMPEKCTLCGVCRESCPVGRLDGLPQIDSFAECLYCYQCVRRCPEGAFDASMWITHPAIRLLSKVSRRHGGQATSFYT